MSDDDSNPMPMEDFDDVTSITSQDGESKAVGDLKACAEQLDLQLQAATDRAEEAESKVRAQEKDIRVATERAEEHEAEAQQLRAKAKEKEDAMSALAAIYNKHGYQVETQRKALLPTSAKEATWYRTISAKLSFAKRIEQQLSSEHLRRVRGGDESQTRPSVEIMLADLLGLIDGGKSKKELDEAHREQADTSK